MDFHKKKKKRSFQKFLSIINIQQLRQHKICIYIRKLILERKHKTDYKLTFTYKFHLKLEIANANVQNFDPLCDHQMLRVFFLFPQNKIK